MSVLGHMVLMLCLHQLPCCCQGAGRRDHRPGGDYGRDDRFRGREREPPREREREPLRSPSSLPWRERREARAPSFGYDDDYDRESVRGSEAPYQRRRRDDFIRRREGHRPGHRDYDYYDRRR